MRVILPLLVVLPVMAAAASLLLWRSVRLQQALAVAAVATCVLLSALVVTEVAHGGVVAIHLGGWEAPVGITLVADLLSALLLCVSLVTVLAVLAYAIGQPRANKRAFYFHPLYLVLTAGVSASFLTGDLFNLFVAFEVMLSASYVLLTLGGGKEQVRSGMTYVVINLLASTLLVTAVGLIYAATGSVNMADVAQRLADVPAGVRSGLGLLLLLTLGIKAAIFPLFFWLPDSYPTAPVTVTAVFAGLLTKVGVYAIIRTQTLLFPGNGASTLLLALAAATMIVGVLGAIAQNDIKRILSFHIVSQIGYMLFGLALFSIAGLAGAIVFTIHQIPVKTALFLVGGIVETTTGTAALDRLGGFQRRNPLTAILFLLAALSLAGLPPFSGFIGKLALVQAGLSGQAWTVTSISLAVSALTLFSMVKIWTGVFWGQPDYDPPLVAAHGDGPLRPPALMTGATIGLVAVTLGIALAAGPLWTLSERAATGLLQPATYIEAVLTR
ncbi:MAG TPA: proton-conducting transporter membrane subunit [Egibacteraceae bacterium]|nr:proton-conducting transporter membrane subunit [Egibacteraceae bacterium]